MLNYNWSNLYFQHHYCSLQCHVIFRNHNNIHICFFKKKILLILKSIIFSRFLWWIKSQHLSEIEIVCNIINVFTVTFDQFKAFLMNTNINFYPQKITLTPRFWIYSVYNVLFLNFRYFYSLKNPENIDLRKYWEIFHIMISEDHVTLE